MHSDIQILIDFFKIQVMCANIYQRPTAIRTLTTFSTIMLFCLANVIIVKFKDTFYNSSKLTLNIVIHEDSTLTTFMFKLCFNP